MTIRQSSAAVLRALWALCLFFVLPSLVFASSVPVPDTGWRLVLDDHAKWQDDHLYLPDEVNLASMPVNPPTDGWASLNSHAGIPVALPSTVEEHYWEKPPSQTPASGSPSDIIDTAGEYLGVSWWYRPFTAPALRHGEHLIFSFPGAHLRAEVYVNGKLVGYDLIGETPFTADATDALKPGGQNLLAVRITNPGGRLDWIDYYSLQWGGYTLPATHAFGGMDGGVTMEVSGPVSVTDLAVLNHPDLKTVTLRAEIISTGPAYDGPVALTIDRRGSPVWSGRVIAHVPAGGTATATKDVTLPSAELWGVGHPRLYQATANLPSVENSSRAATFGFRWFTATGIGTDAKIMLNGRRFVPLSAISWGFWAPNGMFPDRAAADREVAAVKAFGLTGLQNHRHMPKPTALDAFDRAGLLWYCEPGNGVFTFSDGTHDVGSTQGAIDTSGAGGQPTTFTARYELAKVLAMVKADRSHPSVIVWTLQNEVSADLHNPAIFYTLRKMREADPSRIILLKSGIDPGNQVWSLPYSNDWMHDDGKGFSGWSDSHTFGSSAGVYQDGMYRSPTDFIYRTDNMKEIAMWGEMATGASPDDHAADLAWYKAAGRPGYDRAAHEAILAAYDQFLDERHFRSAFPTAESLFLGAGNKHYFSAARVMENARICDANDYIVLSGWESTAIEDHSGLVDSLRFLKGDPSPLKRACAPALLVVRPRRYVVAKGEAASVDVHLVNEINLHGSYDLAVEASMPGSGPFYETTTPVTVTGGETFGQLLKEKIAMTPPQAGMVTVRAALSAPGSRTAALERTEQFLCVDTQPAPLTEAVAVAGTSAEIRDALQKQFGVTASGFTSDSGRLDTILVATTGSQGRWQTFSVPDSAISGTPDPGLYSVQDFGGPGPVRVYHGLAHGPVKVELFFADTYYGKPGQRVFDVALNGKTVLKNFDIAGESGGAGHALIKTFTSDAPDGDLTVTVPNVETNNATFAAIRVTDANGAVTRDVFRAGTYKDSAGNVWNPVPTPDFDWVSFLKAALPRVHDDGTRLVLLTSGGDDAAAAAAALADQHLLTFSGSAGDAGPSWLGFWYFGKKHWLLDGLPSDCVLDWPYQIGSGNGLYIGGPDVDAVIGYGKNHDPKIGIGAAVITDGKGRIVLLALPGLERAFSVGDAGNFQPVTAKRLVYNALRQ